ncbi:MAG TPA: DUF4910 domain-containing protein [Clostridia bacterium]|nr:DUF4910 domain-containing protein [Clostridia bacterium]
MTHQTLYTALRRHADPDRCMETMRRIWENDRLFSFDAFGRTAQYCAARIADAGFAEVETLPLTADGRTAYGDWVVPQAWDAGSARLEILSPTVEEPLLAAYPDTPCSLVMYSAPTPPEGALGEVLAAEDASALAGLDLSGKLLFVRKAPPSSMLEAAIRGGALGVLSDFFPMYRGVRESRADVYEHCRWENTFAKPLNEAGLFAFSLSPRQGDRLQALLASGPVTLRAHVDTRSYDGAAATVTGLLPGKTREEVLGYGHLYEPGAEDNASGCAALIEALWLLREAIDSGGLPPPERGIRVAMGFECAGSMGYFAMHPERIGSTRAGLVADMVGTQDIDRTSLTVWHNPQASAGYVDRLILEQIKAVASCDSAPFPYREQRFSIGTDNILADPCFRMPTVALIAEPALSYHSSMDRAERIEPQVLLRSAILCAMYLYAAANLPEEAFVPDPVPEAPPLNGDTRVPVRRVLGCLTLEGGERVERMPEQERAKWQPAWNTRLNTPLFWADGSRTVAQIAALSARELNVKDPAAYAEEIGAYFTFLAQYGYLDWKE